MDFSRFLMVLLLFSGFCFAFTVRPDYLAIKDTGSDNLDTQDVRITIDCDTKDLSVLAVSNRTHEPIEGADLVLFYTEYGYNPLPNPATTNANGEAEMIVPGNLQFLTKMFILRVDAQNYQSREIEFYYAKCFQAPPPIQPPTPPVQNVTNQTHPNPGQNNTSQPLPPQNNTQPANQSMPGNQNASNVGNNTNPNQPAPNPLPSAPLCPFGGMAIISLIASAFIRWR